LHPFWLFLLTSLVAVDRASCSSSSSRVSSMHAVGGYQKVDLNAELRGIFQQAMTNVESSSTISVPLGICAASILSVEAQVVSGMNYRFTVQGCPATDMSLREACSTPSCDDHAVKTYHITVWVQSWTDTCQVTDIQELFMNESDPHDEVFLSNEEALVDTWLEHMHLNAYGDAKDTMYMGGTPLFNEMTGEMSNRIEYLTKKFPDRPWRTKIDKEQPVFQWSTTVAYVVVLGIAVVLGVMWTQKATSKAPRYTPLYRSN